MLPRDWRIGLAALLLSGLAASACATSQPQNASATVPNTALDYYPLLPGWGWAYDIGQEGTQVLGLYSVAERRSDRAIIKHGEERIEYALLPDGIARREGSMLGDYILKSPVRNGASWPVSDGSATLVETGKSVAEPAGNFRDCAVVEEARRDPGRVTRTTYCRNVGPVEIEMRVLDPRTQSYEPRLRARLRAVSRPESAAAD